jgi:DNA-nicking Smr family endonuclease
MTSDHEIWRTVLRTVKPLKKQRPRSDSSVGAAARGSATERAAKEFLPKRPKPYLQTQVYPPLVPLLTPPELVGGTPVGVDTRTVERLRRGRLAIEATIDLHGMTQAEAHAALDGFLAAAQARGQRCLLIITGKGTLREDIGMPRHGVLRQQVPRWLNQRPNRDRVLAFAGAQQRHGGAGALYVLLKRRR